MRRRLRRDPPVPTPVQQQRLDGWIRMLDVDLDLAQQMLRLPLARLPLPPLALPAVRDWNGDVLAPAVEAPAADEAAPVVPTAPVGLRGAYARRAAARRGGVP